MRPPPRRRFAWLAASSPRPRRATSRRRFASRTLLATLVLFALLAFASFASRAAWAHETRAARLVLERVSDVEARIVVSASSRRALALDLVPRGGCTLEGTPPSALSLRCARGIAGATLEARALGDVADVVVVHFAGFDDVAGAADASSVLTARERRLTLPGAPRAGGVATRYVHLGVEHVLGGFDHVLLILALFWRAWLVGGGALRRVAPELARTATAFTVAHSATLTLTALGLLRVPSSVAEACIAWSLVLVALDLARSARGPAALVMGDMRSARGPAALVMGDTTIARAALAGAFGLVHGLGFAGALAETGLPAGRVATALLAFNVGVELGQLVLLALMSVAAASLAAWLARTSPRAASSPRLAAFASAYVVGGAGAFMFLDRLRAVFPR